MEQNLKFKGKLRNFLNLPLFFTILLLILNIPIYFVDRRAGAILAGFVIIYFIFVFISYVRNSVCHAVCHSSERDSG